MSTEKMVMYDDERARFVVEFYRGNAYLHLTIRQWGMDTARELRARWPQIKAILSRIGFDRLYAYNLEKDAEKYKRFMGPFGFVEHRRLNGFIVMECLA